MYDIFSYPIGADTPSAPWNNKEPLARNFDVIVQQSIYKKDIVGTNQYDVIMDADGAEAIDTKNINWKNEWMQQNVSIIELLRMLKKYVENDIKNITIKNHANRLRIRRLENIINACDGWVLDSIYVEEE